MKQNGGGRRSEANRAASPSGRNPGARSDAPSRGKPAPPPAVVTPARMAAMEILLAVAEGEGHSDDLLHSPRIARLSPEDRNLTTALVMGVLRWQIALDAEIAKYLSRPDEQLPEPVAVALRLGAFQLRHMDRIPAHAALSESVELCRVAGYPRAAGMVNAVLRRINSTAAAGVPIVETPARFAQRLGHPRWLVERWAARYGRSAALAICEYDQQEPGRGSLFGPAPPELPEIDDGSRMVAEIAAAAVPSASAPRVWDCCAAPGGKTLVLAARLPAAEILATDVSTRRLQTMQRRFAATGTGERIRTAAADASAPPLGTGEFDLILCDVPCSGTGTLARNPEIRLHLGPGELPRQAARQSAILRAAIRHLAPGGRVVYSTCSLEPEENEAVLDAALAGIAGELRLVPVEQLLSAIAAKGVLPAEAVERLQATAVRSGMLRTLPGVHPCDGFFAAVFERSNA